MAGDCKTAATMLTVMAGKDPLDNYTSAIPFDTIPDYAASCTADGLKGARIGNFWTSGRAVKTYLTASAP